MEDIFNMEKALEGMGYVTQEKERECLSTKGHIAIWYAVDNGYYDEWGHPAGCVIEDNGARIYEGKMPDSLDSLNRLLESIHIR